MSKGAKIFVISIFSFCIVSFLIAFVVLNVSPMSRLRSNEINSMENNRNAEKDEESEVAKLENTTANTNDIADVDTSDSLEVPAPTSQSVKKPTYTEISSYKTTIYDKEKNRIYNINLATSKLDGAIVKAGEEFSFNKTIGAMSAKQGFKKATGFNR